MIMENTNEKEELTLQNVPKAVNYLINEIAEMRVMLEYIEKQLGLGVDKHKPIEIEDACRILSQTDRQIKKMIRNNSIPYYKQGKKIYFFEDELIKWIEKFRVATIEERFSKNRRTY